MALIERFKGSTAAAALATRATSDSGSVFLRLADGTVVTYGEVESRTEALAAALADLGVETGDRVALLLPAGEEFVLSLFAVARLGATVVPLDPRLTPAELRYLLRHSEAVCCVTMERVEEMDFLEFFEDLLVSLPELQYLVTVGEEDLWYDDRIFQFEDLLSAGAGRDYVAPDIDPERDCLAILYTSGTTGKPKGVKLSHANILSVAAGTADALGIRPDDRVVGVGGFHHVFGLGPGIMATLLAGASIIVKSGDGPEAVLDLVEGHGATVHYGIPTDFVAELWAMERSPRSLGSLRLAMIAGAPAGDELVRQVRARICPNVVVAYSLTETASTLCVSRWDDDEDKQAFTVGRPLPGTTLRILEKDGSVLPVESVGEIAVRGPGVMLGYYRQPRETSNSLDAEGYFLTGDLGMLDEDGYLHLVGRSKEVIIRSGFNVYPMEVEARLESHPAVHEVAVVGMADPFLGEAICACVVPVEGAIVTESELVAWCQEVLADHKVPDNVRFFDGFPHTGSGKIHRVEISRSLRAGSHPGT
ncbi:MAG: AMP-binding protein [Gemmatimonadota bacterium]|nr:AMP-binding protein [Gemmatimonadota bacterium]